MKNNNKEKIKKKKTNEFSTFIFGWIASIIAVALPILIVMYITDKHPELMGENAGKINVLAYIFGSFSSGLFTTYRVYKKGQEKDGEISNLTQENNELKKAYEALTPKKKIISILTSLHEEGSAPKKTKSSILELIIKKIKEINEDSFMDSSWQGMVNYLSNHASFNEFNQPLPPENKMEGNSREGNKTYKPRKNEFEIEFNIKK